MARSGRGRNSADQLGDGSTTYRQMPVQVRDDAGAIVDTTLRATLRGRPRAIPRPGDPDGRSTAGITLEAERGEVGWRLQVQQLLVPATEAYIHEGGPAALCSISCCHPRLGVLTVGRHGRLPGRSCHWRVAHPVAASEA